MQLENDVSDDFKWHGSWSGHGIEVDRGIRLCGDCSPLFLHFVPGIWDSCGTDQKGNVWTGGDKLLWRGCLSICIVAYLLIPAVIYVASYLSYGNGMGNGNVFQTMWENQQLMLHYHEKTVFEHPYASEWYEWGMD
ncbi:MAG: hypothetical protein ACLR8P_12815 [Clostridium fessum]